MDKCNYNYNNIEYEELYITYMYILHNFNPHLLSALPHKLPLNINCQ